MAGFSFTGFSAAEVRDDQMRDAHGPGAVLDEFDYRNRSIAAGM
jgi:hypothetical protein